MTENLENSSVKLILLGASLKGFGALAFYYGFISEVLAGAMVGAGMLSIYGGAFFFGGAILNKVLIEENKEMQKIISENFKNTSLTH